MLESPRPSLVSCAIAAALALAITGSAQHASFAAPERLRSSDGKLIDCGDRDGGGYAAPTLHDIDGDGLQDLVVGQFSSGHVRVYRALGLRNGRRAFAAPEFVRAAGELFAVPMG